MTEASAWGEFGRWLGQAVVVGIGWGVVHRLSANRDRDKARRELVVKSADSLIEAVGPILTEARAYHLDERREGAELRLKMALQDLAMRVHGLSDVCTMESVLAPCRSEVAALRRSITGKHFEDEHLGPVDSGDQQLEAIADAAMRAKRQFLRLKHLQFPVDKGPNGS